MSEPETMVRRVTILGNGIVGLACAYHLSRSGFAVTVVDRSAVDEGTSTGNAGGIAAAEIIPIAEPGLWKRLPRMLLDPLGPLHLRLGHLPHLLPWFYRFLQACRPEDHAQGIAAIGAVMQHALADHRALLDEIGGKQLLSGEGTLFIYRSEQARDAEAQHWQARARHGIEAHALDRGGLLQYEPALGPAARAGYFAPGWAHYRDPKELLVRLADYLQGAGVAFEQADIRAVETASGRASALLTADGRQLDVENLLICAGAWSGRLSRQLGEPFPIEADRGYNTTLPAPGIEVRNMLTFAEDNFVVTPMQMGLRIGGAVEMGGLDAEPNYARSKALLKLARRYFPDLQADGGTEWMGHRPSTPDSVPVISASATCPNVHYAFGHGHLGLSMSVTTGRIVADLIAGRDPGLDMVPYRIDRYR